MGGSTRMSIFDDFDAHGGVYSGIPSVTGNVDIMHDGMVVDTVQTAGGHAGDYVVDNVMGGRDIYHNGALMTHTQPNVFGGEDIYHGHYLDRVSIPNVHGGVDFYDSNYHYEGLTIPNVFGSEDLISNFSNEHEILLHEDPLQHVKELKLPRMEWKL